MKQLITFALFTLIAIPGFCQSTKEIFESPNLETVKSQHKIVAILPFNVTISYKKQPKNFSEDGNREQEIAYGSKIQTSLYTYLLRKQNDYTVQFQDVEKTNILLKKAGVYDKLDQTTMDSVAKILGVDAVISGNFNSEQVKSEGAAIGMMVLNRGYGGKTGDGHLIMSIHNGSDGELLWRFDKIMAESISTSTEDLIEHMMRKVSRKFPYQK